MNDQRNDAARTLFAFLAGAIIGAGVGILLAPRSGKETRRHLSDLAQRAQEKAADIADRLRGRPVGVSEEMKARMNGA